MSTFSKGDKVRLIEAEHVGKDLLGQTGVLTGVGEVFRDYNGKDHTFELRMDDAFGTRIFAVSVAKVEPEWVVGQQVSGSDYERLPVGSRATWTYRTGSKPVPSVKVGDDSWCEGEGVDAALRSNREMHLPRTLTYLPEHAEPEDATDAYVEPEPLKEGEGWGILARQVGKASHYRFTDGDRVIFDGMAVVEPDGYDFTLKPWVEEPTTDYAIVRDGFRTLVRLPIDQRQPGAIYRPWVVVGSDIACAWDDLGEHVVVSGGAS